MAQAALKEPEAPAELERLPGAPPPPPPPPEPPPEEDPFRGIPPGPPVSNARLGMAVFLGAEAMFFAGLIGAFLVFRLGSPAWPPPFQPRLPVGVTGANTLLLLLSAYAMGRALRAIRRGDGERLAGGLLAAALLGAAFLAIQGYEWVRLVRFGLTVSSGPYGFTFYTLVGIHGLHVLGALLWLLAVLAGARRGRFSERRHVAVEMCAIYWFFVVGLWPILYGLVYLW